MLRNDTVDEILPTLYAKGDLCDDQGVLRRTNRRSCAGRDITWRGELFYCWPDEATAEVTEALDIFGAGDLSGADPAKVMPRYPNYYALGFP
jgi:hypothetical protein